MTGAVCIRAVSCELPGGAVCGAIADIHRTGIVNGCIGSDAGGDNQRGTELSVHSNGRDDDEWWDVRQPGGAFQEARRR